MPMKKFSLRSLGFALPTVMISSVVLLMLLMLSVQIVMSSRTAMNDQQHQLSARMAAESGVAAAKSCLKNNLVWTSPLQPNSTDCTGTNKTPTNCGDSVRDARCGVIDSAEMRTSYSVSTPQNVDGVLFITVTGTTQLFRKVGGAEYKKYTHTLKKTVLQSNDYQATRATQRFWYFGYRAALDFGTSGNNATSFLNTSPACSSYCTAPEGSTVVTNFDGNLIFWTNGQTVWDSAGNVMQNSQGMNAGGSSTQAAASFPLNKERTRYAIVTNTAVSAYSSTSSNGAGELYYSVVDMTLRGGLGAVTSKNVPLRGTTMGYSSEASTAAPKADGKGYWVVTYNPNDGAVLVFDFDENGLVSTTPQEFAAGMTIGIQNPDAIGFGTLNFNASYNRLALMSGLHCVSGASPCNTNMGYVRTMKFNNLTGVVTNEFAWDLGKVDATNRAIWSNGYSADFSPDDKYIYATSLYPGRLYRYTLEGNSTSTAVRASEKYVALIGSASSTSYNEGGGQVKRAPNGKMYVANHSASAISVINAPNAAPTGSQTVAQAIGWQYNGQPLASGSTSRFGLPQMVTAYSPFMLVY